MIVEFLSWAIFVLIMKAKKLLIILPFFFQALVVIGQQDTLFNKTMEEVVVTATRTERKLGNVAVPVRIIDQRTIQRSGSLRLKDILQEQSGLYITNGFGAGVQIQGLNPDYTLILVDGEPLVGRTAGVLDLNRISVGAVKKVEIVKGPSSSLYGSEAMAGVINIITDRSFRKNAELGVRFGFGDPDKGWASPWSSNAFKTLDLNGKIGATLGKFGWQYSTDALLYDGVSFRLFSTDRVAQPIRRFTNLLQLHYAFNQRTKLSLNLRHTLDHIKQEFATGNNGNITTSYGRELNRDLNINPVLQHQISKNLQTSFRGYYTSYNGSQRLRFREIPDSAYTDEFRQTFYRLENQTDYNFKKATLTAGAGYSIDQARSTRYDDKSSIKENHILYGFVQHEWRPSANLTLIGGFRYDDNRLFAGAFSPKLAVRYKFGPKISLHASVGRGFKAPDFRQLYLNFTNNAAGGYSVFGTIDAVKIIRQMQQMGQILEIKDDYYRLSTLTPEFSTGMNAGASIKWSDQLSGSFNLFRNDIENLIDVRQVATKSNGGQVFSYINVKKAFTQGGEFEIKWKPLKTIAITGGYQFLNTADKDELQSVKDGKQFTRDANGYSRLLKLKEYIGLPNRSRHMANLRITWERPDKFYATLRFSYRSKWAVADKDGNGIYNEQDEFANGFMLTNLTAGRELANGWRLQLGADNLMNYRDLNYLPNLPGRMIYLSAQYNFFKNRK